MRISLDSRQAVQGFTLVELAVVTLIIAVLAAVAYPQYQEYVRQGRRAEAMSALTDGAQKLERFYSANGTYLGVNGQLATVFTTQIPAAGTPYYVIGADPNIAPTARTYSLIATATAGGLMSGDKCGNFLINQAGTQDNRNNSATPATCWRH